MDGLPRKPLAFGMQKWGPLPGTDFWLLWGGPGVGLLFCAGDPEDPATPPGRYIQHPSANGIYYTIQGADQGAQAFLAAGTCKEEKA
jgi:hypothetical protein